MRATLPTAVLLAAASCTGEIFAPRGPAAEPGGELPEGPCTAGLPAPRLWRLTHPQYAASLAAALGLGALPDVSALPPDATQESGAPLAPAMRVTEPLMRGTFSLVEVLTDAAPLSGLLPCSPANPDDEGCVSQFLTRFGRAAWRRPLAPAEHAELLTAYRAARAIGGGAAAVRASAQRLLLSPHFHYRFELGEPASERRALTPHELAAQLAYQLWGAPPDAELAAAADDGTLASPDVLARQAERMVQLGTPARETLQRFLEQWLGVAGVEAKTKDPVAVPGYRPEVLAALAAETRASLSDAVWGEGGIEGLLLGEQAYVSAETAAVWGVSGFTGPRRKVTVPRSVRLGVLTHPAVLAAHSQESDTGVVSRGLFVATGVLCLDVTEPPPGLDLSVFSSADPNLTTRQRLERHRSDPVCASCHRVFDPPGLVLEGYDPLGAHRTHEHQRPIDTSGEVLLTTSGPVVTVGGAVDLMQTLGTRDEVYRCVATQYFRSAFGRPELPADACDLRELAATFARERHDLKALVKATVGLDQFRFRSAL